MTKQRDPKITIQEIILACENAIQFIEGMAFDQILIAGCMDSPSLHYIKSSRPLRPYEDKI